MSAGAPMMREFELAVKAVGDPTRTRILKLLESGGLCVCQVQAVLGLAPSTVSKHLTILKLAGLVVDRREGKWITYALAGDSHNPYARRVLALLEGHLDEDAAVVADRKRLRAVRAIPLTDLCSLAPVQEPLPPGAATAVRRSRRRRLRATGRRHA